MRKRLPMQDAPFKQHSNGVTAVGMDAVLLT